jgi:hypothetical protein
MKISTNSNGYGTRRLSARGTNSISSILVLWLHPFGNVAASLHRRPGERRDPYAVSSRSGNLLETFCDNRRPGLWVPAFAGTTMVGRVLVFVGHGFTISRPDRPEVYQKLPQPSKQRAQGTPGARCTRGLVCKQCTKTRTRAYRSAEAIRHSLRNGFNGLITRSPRCPGLIATVARAPELRT